MNPLIETHQMGTLHQKSTEAIPLPRPIWLGGQVFIRFLAIQPATTIRNGVLRGRWVEAGLRTGIRGMIVSFSFLVLDPRRVCVEFVLERLLQPPPFHLFFMSYLSVRIDGSFRKVVGSSPGYVWPISAAAAAAAAEYKLSRGLTYPRSRHPSPACRNLVCANRRRGGGIRLLPC